METFVKFIMFLFYLWLVVGAILSAMEVCGLNMASYLLINLVLIGLWNVGKILFR
jgi:hypothetical protein